jgi:hypothetical protein
LVQVVVGHLNLYLEVRLVFGLDLGLRHHVARHEMRNFKRFFSVDSRSQCAAVSAKSKSVDFGMAAALSGLKSRGYEPSIVYDVGAAEGGWTAHALKYLPDATFICFEPLAERRTELETLRSQHPEQGCSCMLADLPTQMEKWSSAFLQIYGRAVSPTADQIAERCPCASLIR